MLDSHKSSINDALRKVLKRFHYPLEVGSPPTAPDPIVRAVMLDGCRPRAKLQPGARCAAPPLLRTPQKIFDGLTPIEMMVGGSTPAYDALTPEERVEAFLDVVAEELSHVR